jgi:hypothetical protein
MAKVRTGGSSIIYATRIICRMVGKYGTFGIAQKTTPAFTAAVVALVAACQAWEALDDYPGEIDQTAPTGSEDDEPAEG